IALVERLVARDGEVDDAQLLEDQIEAVLRTLQRRGEEDCRYEVGLLDLFAGGARLRDALLGDAGVLPPGEQVLEVPLALAVADKDQRAGHVAFLAVEAEHV